jgi:TatD DNase family protein
MSIPANARRNESFTRMLQTLPRERILFETDCPYLGPEKDIINEPANVAKTLAFTSELWDVAKDVVIEQVSKNYLELFGADDIAS